MKRAKERQITFYADPDVYEWLKKQESVTRYVNAVIRSAMSGDLRPESSSKLAGITSNSAITRVVSELEQIQDAILKSYRRQQAMIGALRTHQKLFEKSATFYREIGRIRDEEEVEPLNEVSGYHELLINSADSIKSIIESNEADDSISQTVGIRERLIAAIETDRSDRRDVDAPARSFSLNVRKESED